jgi:phosphocarrier protein HPr
MIQQEIEIINKLGLHARASAKFTQTAGKFNSEVWLTRNSRRGKGSKVLLETNGVDEQDAFDALLALVNDKFGEGE